MKITIQGLLGDIGPVDIIVETDMDADKVAEFTLNYYEAIINKMSKSRIDRMADKIRAMLGL